MDAKVVVGLFLGGMLPFLFSAFTMSSVGEAANKMIEEVRRQFREKPGKHLKGHGKAGLHQVRVHLHYQQR